ncbi:MULTISPECIES: UDP-N-acetylglucosamine 2-epimerase [Lentzea]|uniref:UDP-N-acetyl glucosamine 2-epimerase n=1 Tax=Lentzea flava TaxID=103732 RepID=A0ABQ2UCS1_9PSEU|nr:MULTISPECIES: UDP-N-acetylglucosamine 2-epimerase [Lentzea]MBM7857710.1 UDP-N-acetylglucosamine 2-epimerase (non-hydrolyzing) [Lentzea nigeriaca]MCP2197742.1 UDP-N-acetylglucosamine 2-epimerase (non-hydrolyzing) [Lentzea flava]GGU21858.1 UDP-N-acetyl glucosamine 2-epimerase [Lentzea flava]
MISFILGTTAELIKIAPVFHAISERGTKPQIWFTAQHVDHVAETLADLQLPEPSVWLVPKEQAQHIERPAQVPGWAATVMKNAWSRRHELKAILKDDGRPPLVLVHGDTFTTPYGAFIGKRILRARVGHIEAGARSGSLLSPLPEELNRKLAAKIVDLHFAPTAKEVNNLRNARGAVINTGANTAIDAMRLAIDAEPTFELPEEFGLATLHRFELVSRRDKYTEALELLKKASERMPILYLAGPPEQERIKQYGLGHLFDGERLIIKPKLRYLAFLPIMARAKFVVTDSGGLQAECNYLGVPCAIHRERTEDNHGGNTTLLLTGMDGGKLQGFLDDYESYRRPSKMDDFHPSKIVVDTLSNMGFC